MRLTVDLLAVSHPRAWLLRFLPWYYLLQGLGLASLLLVTYTALLTNTDLAMFPWLLGIGALSVGAVSRIFAFLERRLFAAHILLLASLFMVALSAGLWVLGGVLLPLVLAPLLFVGLQLVQQFDALLGWGFTEKLFDMSAARRLLDLQRIYLAVGRSLGFLVAMGGYALLGPMSLLGVATLAFLLSSVLLWRLLREKEVRYRLLRFHARNPLAESLLNPEDFVGYSLHYGYVMRLFLFAMCLGTVYALLQYLFFRELFVQDLSGDFLPYVLGTFFTLVYAMAALLRLRLRVHQTSRSTLRTMLLHVPLALLLLTLLLVFMLGSEQLQPEAYVLAMGMMAYVLVSGQLMYVPVGVALSLPMLSTARGYTFTMLKGLVFPVGIGLGVLILLLGDVGAQGHGLGVSIWLFFWLLTAVGLALFLASKYQRLIAQHVRLRNIENFQMAILSKDFVQMLKDKLSSEHPDEVIYALEGLSFLSRSRYAALLQQQLASALPDVQRYVLGQLRRLRLYELLPDVRERLQDASPDLGQELTHTLVALSPREAEIRLKALDPDHFTPQHAWLLQAVLSGLPGPLYEPCLSLLRRWLQPERPLHALSLGLQICRQTVPAELMESVVALMAHPNKQVRRLAIEASAGYSHSDLPDRFIQFIRDEELAEQAALALERQGMRALKAIAAEVVFEKRSQQPYLLRLCQTVGHIGGAQAHDLLWAMVDYPWTELRIMAYQALIHSDYLPANEKDLYYISDHLDQLVYRLYWLYSSLQVLGQYKRYYLLSEALRQECKLVDRQLAMLLQLLAKGKGLQPVYYDSGFSAYEEEGYWEDVPEEQQESRLWELLPRRTAELLLVVRGYYSAAEKSKKLSAYFSHQPLDDTDVLVHILRRHKNEQQFGRWTLAMALRSLSDFSSPTLLQRLQPFLRSDDLLLLEAATDSLRRYCLQQGQDVESLLSNLVPTARQHIIMGILNQQTRPLMEVEKVVILRGTKLFSEIPAYLLPEVGSILQEYRVNKGSVIFHKGDLSTSLYIVYDGEVRLHDGHRTIDTLVSRDVFGELGLLQETPRTASAVALRDTLLLRIDQEDFLELMVRRKEFVQSIMRVLSGRIRQQSEQLLELRRSPRQR